MKPVRPGQQKPKKKLPYLTDEELNAPVVAVKIKIHGEYFKRGEHRNDVYEAPYETEIVVPKSFNMGHVKLQANRDVKRNLNGVRVRTFYVDTDYQAEPVTDKKYIIKDFMSEMTLQDNERNKQNYREKLERAAREREAREDPDYTPAISGITVESRLTEDHDYSA